MFGVQGSGVRGWVLGLRVKRDRVRLLRIEPSIRELFWVQGSGLVSRIQGLQG